MATGVEAYATYGRDTAPIFNGWADGLSGGAKWNLS